MKDNKKDKRNKLEIRYGFGFYIKLEKRKV